MHQTTQHIPAIIQALEPTVNKYGYLGVGGLLLLEDFGVPVPGETVLIAAAFFAGLGHLNIFLVFLVGFLGAVIGDNIGFAIGEYGGHPLIERYGKYIFLTPERVHKAEMFYNRNGGKVVVVARFIEGLRQANGIIAGLSEMKWFKFVVYQAIGALLWVGFWSTIGYFGGNHIGTFLRYQTYASVTFLVLLLGYIAFRILKKRRESVTPANTK